MYKIYFYNWDGMDEYEIERFESYEEAIAFIKEEIELLSSEEGYILYKDDEEVEWF